MHRICSAIALTVTVIRYDGIDRDHGDQQICPDYRVKHSTL
ncbi:hypothetical protein [Chlorogloeopsis sp. ULAP02]